LKNIHEEGSFTIHPQKHLSGSFTNRSWSWS